MSAPASVIALVDRFHADLAHYRAPQYKETEARQEFIDPLFKALGWDIGNERGAAAAFREVQLEYSMKIGASTKAPDYLFRFTSGPKFFVEAKKPSVNLRESFDPAFQLRRYAWTAKLPLSVLTDFDEWAIYDTRVEPSRDDAPSVARYLYLPYTQYVEQWDSIANLFSRESVLAGSLERFAQEQKAPRGALPVDRALLADIDNWRGLLAKNIFLWDQTLSVRDLNYAVQMTLDRIIFLRICEDRGIEPYGKLEELIKGGDVYTRLQNLFRAADDRYNSGLFHFTHEKVREGHDTLTPTLHIDDEPLQKIIRGLYYPYSPYEFSVMPVEVLGNVYEQFLGSVITIGAERTIEVEQKPEVRKAGGVYYTPQYIVDYIVTHTVGTLVKDKMPTQVEQMRVLDPACGSGSFLIGAFQFLIDWHLAQYVADGPQKYKKQIYQLPDGAYRLTPTERKRILLNNIYGVDLDAQAVEVTKLSLCLKMLEGETSQTIAHQQSFLQQRVLPDLSANIKCGNALIGPDFYATPGAADLGADDLYRINAFDWQTEFPAAMRAGGFDAVIGNPPYVFGRDWKALDIPDKMKQYLGNRYTSSPYQLDMFSIFMEKVHELCKLSGCIGQIVPNVWLTNMYSSTTRSFILNHSSELRITVPPPGVFAGITVDTIVYTLQKSAQAGDHFDIYSLQVTQAELVALYDVADYRDGTHPISTTLNTKSTLLVNRIKAEHPELRTVANITRGVHPYRVGGYGQSAYTTGPQIQRDVEERPYHNKEQLPGYRGFVYGKNLRRFSSPHTTDYVSYGHWLAEPRKPEFFQGSRVYSRKILGDRLVVTVEETDTVADQQVYITLPKVPVPSAAYLAGILGSRLMSFYIRNYYDETNDAFPQIKVGQLQSLPIPDPTTQVGLHNQMADLVGRIIDLNKNLPTAQNAHDKTSIQRHITATDAQIDTLVYALYGLSAAEIAIVEAATKR
ncbi:MAG: TaqI-like C-terminal specificity domain-containing protein [Chloroflexales bacterium]